MADRFFDSNDGDGIRFELSGDAFTEMRVGSQLFCKAFPK